MAIALLVGALLAHRKESKEKKEPKSHGGIKVIGFGTDENTKLVIKSISSAEHGFINFNDIVNDTNLPLKNINAALDWLVIHNFASESDGRRGKVYALKYSCKSYRMFLPDPAEHT
jgi:hypothetical protein